MTAEFASEWLSWKPGDSPETPSHRTDKSANSPSVSFVSSLTRRIQDFDSPETWQEGHAQLRAMERPHSYPAGPWQQLIANSEIFLREWAEEMLSESRLRQQGLINPVPVRRLWSEHVREQRNWQFALWHVLMFQAWLDKQSCG